MEILNKIGKILSGPSQLATKVGAGNRGGKDFTNPNPPGKTTQRARKVRQKTYYNY